MFMFSENVELFEKMLKNVHVCEKMSNFSKKCRKMFMFSENVKLFEKK